MSSLMTSRAMSAGVFSTAGARLPSSTPSSSSSSSLVSSLIALPVFSGSYLTGFLRSLSPVATDRDRYLSFDMSTKVSTCMGFSCFFLPFIEGCLVRVANPVSSRPRAC